jgi:hypothetical protein
VYKTVENLDRSKVNCGVTLSMQYYARNFMTIADRDYLRRSSVKDSVHTIVSSALSYKSPWKNPTISTSSSAFFEITFAAFFSDTMIPSLENEKDDDLVKTALSFAYSKFNALNEFRKAMANLSINHISGGGEFQTSPYLRKFDESEEFFKPDFKLFGSKYAISYLDQDKFNKSWESFFRYLADDGIDE